MNRRSFASVVIALFAMTALLVLLMLMAWTNSDVPAPARAAPFRAPTRGASTLAAPTVTEVEPSSASNDLNTPIVITGTDFAVSATVLLGDTALDDVGWVNNTRLTAIVPWGLVTGTYTMTVINPDGISGTLPNAFTVTQGFDVWTTGGPYGGSVHQVLLHPVTTTTVYALNPAVGVFASYDAGAFWEAILHDDCPTQLSIDAGNPAVMYSGGDDFLFRTMNGGSTWEAINPPGVWDVWEQYRPATHPISPGIVYVGVRVPDNPAENGGLYWSDDYGDTWVMRTAGLTDTHVSDVAFHPDDPQTMLVGTQSGNAFLSADGGQSWTWKAHVGPRIERLYFNPFGAHEAWATVHPMWGTPVPPPYLYKSSPDLTAWTPVTVTEYPDGWVPPVQSLTFVSDTIWAACEYGYTSTDGGASWSPMGGVGFEPMGEVMEFVIEPGNPNVIYAGHSTGGVFKSTNGGATWREMNEGLAGFAPHALAVPRGFPDTVYSWSWERGLLRSDNGGRSWLSLDTWRGGVPSPRMLAVDPFTPTRLYLGDVCFDEMCMRISEDAGNTWRQVTATLPITLSDRWSNVRVVAPHPKIRGRVLVNAGIHPDSGGGGEAGQIFLSDDHGEHWQTIAHSQAISVVGDIVYDAVDPNLVYLVSGGSGLWKSTDGGTTWQAVPIPDVLPSEVAEVSAHSDVANSIYVRVISALTSQLFVSGDAGETWTELEDFECGSAGLLFVPPRPNKPPYALYSACCTANGDGLCRSWDGGQSWEQLPGIPWPSALATGNDDERVVVYVGTPGGVVVVEGLTDRASQVIPGRGSVLGGGVYRMTSRLIPPLYLPLMFRDYAP